MWVRVDDQFPDHIKLATLGRAMPLCGWLYVCGLAFCNRQLTDGRIPKLKVHSLTSFKGLANVETLATLLVRSGLWEEQEHDYLVHDYLDYQLSRAEVLAEREANRARAQTFRARHQKGRNGSSNGVSNGVNMIAPTPTPSSPLEKRSRARPATASAPSGGGQDKPKPKHQPRTTGAGRCPHIPMCASIPACVKRTLDEANARS